MKNLSILVHNTVIFLGIVSVGGLIVYSLIRTLINVITQFI